MIYCNNMYKYTDFWKLNHFFLCSVVGCKFILRVSYSYKLFQKLDNPFREHFGLDTITCSEMSRDSSLHVKVHTFPCWRFHLLKKLGWNVCHLYSISKPRDNVRQKCDCFRKQIIDVVTEEEKLAATKMFHKH